MTYERAELHTQREHEKKRTYHLKICIREVTTAICFDIMYIKWPRQPHRHTHTHTPYHFSLCLVLTFQLE